MLLSNAAVGIVVYCKCCFFLWLFFPVLCSSRKMNAFGSNELKQGELLNFQSDPYSCGCLHPNYVFTWLEHLSHSPYLVSADSRRHHEEEEEEEEEEE